MIYDFIRNSTLGEYMAVALPLGLLVVLTAFKIISWSVDRSTAKWEKTRARAHDRTTACVKILAHMSDEEIENLYEAKFGEDSPLKAETKPYKKALDGLRRCVKVFTSGENK